MNNFVVFSDIHLHEWTYGSKLVTEHTDPLLIGMNDRLVEQWVVINEIVAFCKKNNVNDAFFCGDLFHKFGNITAPVMEIAVRMAKLFHDNGINLTALVGNHDMYSKDGSRHSLHCISGFARVVASPIYIRNMDSSPIACCPYTENKQVLKDFLDNAPDGSIVFMHQGVANVPMASGYVVNEILEPSMVGDNIAFAFTGHYHANRLVSNKLMVVGAPIQQSYADVGETPGFLFVDTASGQIQHIETSGRRFHTIKDENYEGFRKGDFARISGDVSNKYINENLHLPSAIEKIIVPRNVEKITTSINPTIRELVMSYAKTKKLNTKIILDIMEDKHPMLKETK